MEPVKDRYMDGYNYAMSYMKDQMAAKDLEIEKLKAKLKAQPKAVAKKVTKRKR